MFLLNSKLRKKKEILKTFQQCGICIIIECNLTPVNLESNFCKPYRKTNEKPIYINRNSNRPPNILKQLLKSTEKEVSETSRRKKIFEESLKSHQYMLKMIDFSKDLH